MRLSKADQEMVQALNPYLKRLGYTDGSKIAFFRFLLGAAHKGLADLAKQEKLRDAVAAYQDAQRRVHAAQTLLETLVAESGVDPSDLSVPEVPSPAQRAAEGEAHGG